MTRAMHLELTPENLIVRAVVADDYVTGIASGNRVVRMEGVTHHPTALDPDSWFNPRTGMINTKESTNPHLFRAEQEKVFKWARENVLDSRFYIYAAYGARRRAEIFHSVAVNTVMAALIPENITGQYWGQVQANMVPWDEFCVGIDPTAWTHIGPTGVQYAHLKTATYGFVSFDQNFYPSFDWNSSDWAVYDRRLGRAEPLMSAGFDLRRATNITVVPPEDIPDWEASDLEPVENFFTWEPARYRAFLRRVFAIVPIDLNV